MNKFVLKIKNIHQAYLIYKKDGPSTEDTIVSIIAFLLNRGIVKNDPSLPKLTKVLGICKTRFGDDVSQKEFYRVVFFAFGIYDFPRVIGTLMNPFELVKILIFSKKYKTKCPPGLVFKKLVKLLFSKKTQKEVFEPILADWQEEYFEALFKKEIWKARFINVRYTYAFVCAMWMKSPLGDLLEFIRKIAK